MESGGKKTINIQHVYSQQLNLSNAHKKYNILLSLCTAEINHIYCNYSSTNLASCTDPPNAANTDDCPGSKQANHYGPMNTSRVCYGGRTIQGYSVKEVVHSGAVLAFSDKTYNKGFAVIVGVKSGIKCIHSLPFTRLVFIERALTPRKGVLKGVEKIPQDPCYYGIVVQSNQKGHQHRGNS